jgi:hypothetical protein
MSTYRCDNISGCARLLIIIEDDNLIFNVAIPSKKTGAVVDRCHLSAFGGSVLTAVFTWSADRDANDASAQRDAPAYLVAYCFVPGCPNMDGRIDVSYSIFSFSPEKLHNYSDHRCFTSGATKDTASTHPSRFTSQTSVSWRRGDGSAL